MEFQRIEVEMCRGLVLGEARLGVVSFDFDEEGCRCNVVFDVPKRVNQAGRRSVLGRLGRRGKR